MHVMNFNFELRRAIEYILDNHCVSMQGVNKCFDKASSLLNCNSNHHDIEITLSVVLRAVFRILTETVTTTRTKSTRTSPREWTMM